MNANFACIFDSGHDRCSAKGSTKKKKICTPIIIILFFVLHSPGLISTYRAHYVRIIFQRVWRGGHQAARASPEECGRTRPRSIIHIYPCVCVTVCVCVYDYFYYYTSMKIIYSSRLSLFFFLNDKKITFIHCTRIIRYAGHTI